jgi:hypothetical protein
VVRLLLSKGANKEVIKQFVSAVRLRWRRLARCLSRAEEGAFVSTINRVMRGVRSEQEIDGLYTS